MKQNGNILTADIDKRIYRIADSMEMGREVYMGKIWYLNGKLLPEPRTEVAEDFAERNATEEELREDAFRMLDLNSLKAKVNSETDKRILTGFVWRDHNIWLSTENQFNYKAAYDIAVQTKGKNLPVTFKFGTEDYADYFQFEDMDTLEDFYTSAISYVQNTLAEGWKIKDAIERYDVDNLPQWVTELIEEQLKLIRQCN